ncbi:MAG: hypothetical protein JWR34_742 [Mycobacterium sp.]|nr:hypothetical protein [Mycobacterium sp.]
MPSSWPWKTGRTQGHVSVLGVFDAETVSGRPLDAALVRELVTARMHLLPTFRWRLASVPFGLDHPYWVDDGTFDVEYHVQDAALPAPGTQRQLADLVAHLIGRQLDRARPLWELYVIQGLEDCSVAVLTKMHHAAVDGVSGAEVLSVLLDDTATGRDLDAAPSIVAERFPSEVEMLGRGLVGMWRQLLRALKAAPTTLPHLDDVATLRHVPGVKAIARSSRLVKRALPDTTRRTCAARKQPRRPTDSISDANIGTPQGRVRVDVARRREDDQDHLRVHGQRRGPGHLHSGAALMAGRARRTSDRIAAGLHSGTGPNTRTDGDLREPGLGDDH